MVEPKIINNDIAVVISSCDKFRDVWTPFFTLFFRYWSDCPFPIYLITEKEKYKYKNRCVNALCLGEGLDFSSLLSSALITIDEPIVLLILEDFFLYGDVDNRKLEQYIDYFKRTSAAYLRLVANPGPDTPCKNNQDLGIIKRGAEYRLSLQSALWDKEILLGLLNVGESPWELELLGSRRSDGVERPFLSVRTNGVKPIPYHHVIVRGKWCEEAIRFCKQENISLDLDKRAIETQWELFLRSSKMTAVFSPLLAIFPFLRGRNRYKVKKKVASLIGTVDPK